MGNGNVFRFFFGAHAAEEDAEATREHFDWCTVYVPELCGWSFATWAQYRAVASNGVPGHLAAKLLKFTFRAYHTAILKMIEGSCKRIEFVDLPGDHPLFLVTKVVNQAFDHVVYEDCDWPTLMRMAGDMIDAVNIVNRHRGRHIIESLCRLDERLTDQRILVQLGAAHATLATRAAERGLNIQRAFQGIGPHVPEALLVYYGELRRPIPSVVLARHLMLCMINRYCHSIVPPGSMMDAVAWLTRVASWFSESEIAEFWQRFRDDEAEAVQALVLLIRAKQR